MLSLAHVINPVDVPPTSDLALAQPVTFESLHAAHRCAGDVAKIQLYAAFYPEDERIVPAWCKKLRPLDRSVLDIKHFNVPRKLPLIGDILERLVEATDADYLIYTNVDIALMPFFYRTITRLVANDMDAFTVTRRTISTRYTNPADLPLMYADLGEQHPGNDCFVFRRESCRQFDVGNACVGVRFFARVLMVNMIVHSKNFEIFRDFHLTFHLGDDRSWESDRFADYEEHQQHELRSVLRRYEESGKLKAHPYIRRWIGRTTRKPSKNRFSWLRRGKR